MYLVENYDTGEYKLFSTLERANTYVKNYYLSTFATFYSAPVFKEDYQGTFANMCADMQNLLKPTAYIEDLMYIHDGIEVDPED